MKDIDEQLKEAHATLAAASKEIQRLTAEKGLKKQLAKLDKINQVRAELDAVYKKHKITARELAKYPKSYKYRHGRFRSNDANEAWVKDILATGVTLQQLEDNAQKHTLDELKRLSKKGSRKPRASSGGEGNTLKTTAERLAGKTG